MKLSVIVPMYNTEKWIKRCIESILCQSFHDFEIIIIDDGSTDNSLNIVKGYCKRDKRIQCISTKNQGSAMAKNVGLKYMSGDIVTFVDADDFIENKMYEIMISALDTFDADIVECSCRRVNIYGRELDSIELLNEKIEGNEQCTFHFMKQNNTRNYMCNKIYKRELFEGISFPLLHYSEDYYMNAILHARTNKKIVISQIFYNYMIYAGQSTNKRRINAKRVDGIKAGNMIADFFSYDPRLKKQAALYACNYALFLADSMYGFDQKIIKKLLKQIRSELFRTISRIPLNIPFNKNEKKVIYLCLLMLFFDIHFFDFRWLFE